MTLKVAGCAGHGGSGSTPGKRTPDGEFEWNFNNKVWLSFERTLREYEGVEILRTDDPAGRTDVPLETRTKNANAWGADLYVSFHHNANTAKWGTWSGTETFHWGNGKSLGIAKAVNPGIVSAYGLTDRGLKNGSHLWIIKATNMPAILIEGGFMDSVIDIKKLRDDMVLAAAGANAATAIAKLYGLKKKNATKPSPVVKKEEEDMLETAVIINSFNDYPSAAPLASKLQTGIFERPVAEKVQVAKKLYVVGGTKEKLKGNDFVVLSGADRYETAAAVKKFIG